MSDIFYYTEGGENMGLEVIENHRGSVTLKCLHFDTIHNETMDYGQIDFASKQQLIEAAEFIIEELSDKGAGR